MTRVSCAQPSSSWSRVIMARMIAACPGARRWGTSHTDVRAYGSVDARRRRAYSRSLAGSAPREAPGALHRTRRSAPRVADHDRSRMALRRLRPTEPMCGDHALDPTVEVPPMALRITLFREVLSCGES